MSRKYDKRRERQRNAFSMFRDAMRRRFFAMSPVNRPRRALLCWWGILPGGEPTAGDFLAVANVARRLNDGILPTDIATAHTFPANLLAPEAPKFSQARCIRPEDVRPADYGVLIFVCGPLVDNPDLMDFIRQFSTIPRVAAGVSVLPEQPQIQRLFDDIIARDGVYGSLFDLALAYAPRQINRPSDSDAPVAVCLRGLQHEYGKKRCGSKEAESAIERACQLLGGPRLVLDTRINPVDNSLPNLLKAFEQPRVLLTTRLHGALLALLAGRPYVAIDQVHGGAKLSEVLHRLGWPFILQVSEATPEKIVEMAQKAQSSSFAESQAALRQAAIERSEEALEVTCQRVVAAFEASL